MYRNLFFTLLIVLLKSAIVNATELTIEQAIDLAKKQSKELQIVKAELDKAETQIDEAFAAALPNVSADFNYNRNLKDAKFFITAPDPQTGLSTTQELDFTFKNEFSFTAELRQTIYSFGKVGTALDIAYAYQDFAEKNYRYQMQSILTNIRINFYRALLAQKIYDVSKESQNSAESNYKDTKLRYESGAASEYDLLQAEVRWRNSIPQTISAKKNYEQSLNMLKSELGIPIDEPLTLTGSLETRPVFPDSLDTDQVLSQRGDFQALKLESDMRDKNVTLEFANHLPTIDGRFVYTNSAQSDMFKYENNFDNYVAGLSLNIPIYSGGNTSARVQKAELEHRQAVIRVEKAKDTIEMELTNALLNLKEARERITAAEKNEATARRAFEIAESRAENGLATQLELKDSRLLLDQANVTHLTAHFDYLKAYFEWQLITGNWEE